MVTECYRKPYTCSILNRSLIECNRMLNYNSVASQPSPILLQVVTNAKKATNKVGSLLLKWCESLSCEPICTQTMATMAFFPSNTCTIMQQRSLIISRLTHKKFLKRPDLSSNLDSPSKPLFNPPQGPESLLQLRVCGTLGGFRSFG